MTILGYTKQNISNQPGSSCIDGYYVFPNGVNDTNEDGTARNCSEISKFVFYSIVLISFIFSEHQTVYLKCFIEMTELDEEKMNNGSSSSGSRMFNKQENKNNNTTPRSIYDSYRYGDTKLKNSKMKRKYQKRKRRSYITNRLVLKKILLDKFKNFRNRIKREYQNNQLNPSKRNSDCVDESNGGPCEKELRYVDCSVYPSHKILT